jgi:hypothetical protein
LFNGNNRPKQIRRDDHEHLHSKSTADREFGV